MAQSGESEKLNLGNNVSFPSPRAFLIIQELSLVPLSPWCSFDVVLGSEHIQALFAGGGELSWLDQPFSSSVLCSTSAASPGMWESGCLFSACPRSVLGKQSQQGSLLPRRRSGCLRFCKIRQFSGVLANAPLCSLPWKNRRKHAGFTKGILC